MMSVKQRCMGSVKLPGGTHGQCLKIAQKGSEYCWAHRLQPGKPEQDQDIERILYATVEIPQGAQGDGSFIAGASAMKQAILSILKLAQEQRRFAEFRKGDLRVKKVKKM